MVVCKSISCVWGLWSPCNSRQKDLGKKKKRTFKKPSCYLSKKKDLRCCEFRSKKTYLFPGFTSSWPLLYSHIRKLLHEKKQNNTTFWKHCKVTEPESRKCSSVRPHVWLCAPVHETDTSCDSINPSGRNKLSALTVEPWH